MRFRITPGDWPVGYTIDMIGDQTSGIPFGVTLRARGAPDGGYGGTVNLSVPGATVSPAISGPFSAGVRVEVITVTVDGPGHVPPRRLGSRRTHGPLAQLPRLSVTEQRQRARHVRRERGGDVQRREPICCREDEP